MLRLLLIVALLPVLASCVYHQYPAAGRADARYYHERYYVDDDPVYVDDIAPFAGIRYYPWWSVDYFYLGYGQRHANWSIGLGYGPAWYPYRPWWSLSHHYSYWYHDPWYTSYWFSPVYRYQPWSGYAWYQPYWHARYRHYRDDRGYHDDRGRHVGRGDRGHRGPLAGYRDRYENDRPVSGRRTPRQAGGSHRRAHHRSDPGTGAPLRRVSVAPGSRSGDRGMVITSRDGGKWSQSRLEPVGTVRNMGVPRGAPSEREAGARRAPGPVTSQRGGVTVRHSAPAKRRAPATQPVPSPANDRRFVEPVSRYRSSAPPGSYPSGTGDGQVTVRSNAHAKVAPSRVQPTQPARSSGRGEAPVYVPAPRVNAPARSAPQRVPPAPRAPVAVPRRGESTFAPRPGTPARHAGPSRQHAPGHGGGNGSRGRAARSRGDRNR